MNTTQTIILSLLRHGLSMIGGAIIVKEHDSDLAMLAGAISILVPVVWSCIKSASEKRKGQVLQSTIEKK